MIYVTGLASLGEALIGVEKIETNVYTLRVSSSMLLTGADLNTANMGRVSCAVGSTAYDSESGQTITLDENGNWVTDEEVNLMAYAEIYVAANETAQSIPITEYVKITAMATDGEALNCTPDAENGKITIVKPGKYKLDAVLSVSVGTADITLDTAVFVDGEAAANAHNQTLFSEADSVLGYGISAILDLDEDAEIDVRCKHNGEDAVAVTVAYAALNITRIGD